ncbi:MAG TPA: two-component regulator propeller domain-containing protein, partial [Ignavibacteriaceae bacterium]
VSTYNGLNRLNPNKLEEGFHLFFASDTNKNSISDNLVWRVSQSINDKNILWICTANGLCKYEKDKDEFHRLPINPNIRLQFSKSFSWVAEQNVDGNNILWAATYGGLFRIDLNNNNQDQFVSDKKNLSGLLGNQIDQLLIDRSGVLWIGTDKGLNYYSSKAQKFNKIFTQNINDQTSQELLNADVKAIINNGNNEFFIAAYDALFKLSVKDRNTEIKKFNEFNNLNLWSLEKGNNNDLWIGTYGNGLIHYDLTKSQKRVINIESPVFKSSAFKFIKALLLSNDGLLWIGFWGGGLACLDTKTEKYQIWIHDESNPKSLSFNDVWTLYEDKLGRLWIGTNGGGLNLYDPKNNGEFINWKFDANNSHSIINNAVMAINETPSKNSNETILLIGTENGLCKAIVKNSDSNKYDVDLSFDNYFDTDALNDRSISGMLSDDNELLWISSQFGLLRFNTADKSLAVFGFSDGLQSNIFNSNAYCKSESGLMLFGSVKGPVIFNPSKINLSEYEPNIIFTDFQIFNESIDPGEDSPLKTSIAVSNNINLSYDQNTITFNFASLDFNSSEHIHFLYKLEGSDKDWIYSIKRRFATYNNLNPGTYYFRLKATNSDGIWGNTVKSIKVTINPPWWKTGWA